MSEVIEFTRKRSGAKPPLDINDIETAVHEIGQMVLVALSAAEDLMRSDVEPGFFHMPVASAEMLSFWVYDLHKRVAELKGLIGSGECS